MTSSVASELASVTSETTTIENEYLLVSDEEKEEVDDVTVAMIDDEVVVVSEVSCDDVLEGKEQLVGLVWGRAVKQLSWDDKGGEQICKIEEKNNL